MASDAGRIARLERLVSQQGYMILILLVALILDTAAVLVLWHGQTRKPDFDHIAVALSAFQITFAIAALYGFWALRGLTKETAEEVAEREVSKIVPPAVARQVEGVLSALKESVTISDADIGGIVKSFGEKEDGDGQ